jgi:predicted Zn-ribbon and HTH transcriptional regulator
MDLCRGEFERIRSVLANADADEPLTAREILALLQEHGEEFDSAHKIATILGRRARRGDVEIVDEQPYQYCVVDDDCE